MITNQKEINIKSLIKDLGEHPEDKKPVRIMKGQYGPYIKYKSLNDLGDFYQLLVSYE